MFDLDTWEERAAIMEYDGGLSRFRAETEAAKLQGVTRAEAINAVSKRDTRRGGHNRSAMAQQASENHLPGMQHGAKKEKRSMLERNGNRQRSGLALLALRQQRRGVL